MTDASTDGATSTDGVTSTDDGTDESGTRSILRRSYGRVFWSSESLLLRSYAVVSALVAIFLVVLVLLAMPLWIAETEGQTPLNMVGRALLPVVALGLLFPLTGPVLYAEKNHRGDHGSRRSDALLAMSGYLFVGSLYLSLVISAPSGARSDPPAAIAPVIEMLYALPPLAGLVPPILAAILVYAVQRWIWR